jgi:PTS system mannose-specific IIA component
MVGVLLVTHAQLGESLLQNAEYIVGRQPLIAAVSQQPGTGFHVLQSKVSRQLQDLDKGQGVLILVDIYGGTPSKVGLSFVGQRKLAVVTGLNTAMLLKILEVDRETVPLDDLARIAAESARKSVAVYGVDGRSITDGPVYEDECGETPSGEAEMTVVVLNSMGLHASNSAKLVKVASQFRAEISLTKGDMTVNTKSIMGVLMLGATQGTELRVRAVGGDAGLAVETIVELFATRFNEE